MVPAAKPCVFPFLSTAVLTPLMFVALLGFAGDGLAQEPQTRAGDKLTQLSPAQLGSLALSWNCHGHGA
jgi:hypothetical protein